MKLKDILSISGYGGLFRYISQSRNGVIVESLADGKRMNADSSQRISALEDIAIFTDDKEVPLKEVFKTIYQKENGGAGIDPKMSNDKLKNYFNDILPDYDRDRVYVSDMKKVFTWYKILNDLNLIDLLEEENSEAAVENE